MATLKDIASLAGVSQGTVSNVLNGKGFVSSSKIKLVQEAAQKLGYAVNERAKLLRKGRSNILALVLPNTRTRPNNDIYTGFQTYAEQNGYIVSLFLTNDIPAREEDLIGKIRSDMTEGIAAVSCLCDDPSAYYEAGFQPNQLVFLQRKARASRFLGFDQEKAGKAIAEIARGRKQSIALFVEYPFFQSEYDFINGFESVMKSPYHLVKVDRNQRQKSIIAFLSTQPDLSDFFCSNFEIANSLSSVLGAFFPNITPDNITTASPLVSLPESHFLKYEMDYRLLGKVAAQSLIASINDQTEGADVILPSSGFREWKSVPLSGTKPGSLKLLMLNSPESISTARLSRLYTNETGIDIDITIHSYDEIFEILCNGGEKDFDILRIDITFLSWFAEKLLIPLTDLDSDIPELLKNFLPGVASRYSTIGGRIYAIPFSPSVQVLFYRKDLFESIVQKRLYQERYKKDLKPPEDFWEFNRIAEFFTKRFNHDSPVDYGTSLTLGSVGVAGSEFMARFLATHRNLYDEDGVVRLNGSSGIDALQQVIGLKDFAPVRNNTWWTDTASDFSSGRLAMSILYSNYASDLIKESNAVNGRIGYTLVPGKNPILGGASLGISKKSQNKEASLNYIKWLCSETVSSASALLGGASACKAAYDNQELLESYPWLDLCGQSFSIADGHRQDPKSNKPFDEHVFLNIIGMALKNAYDGLLSPEEALNKAQKAFDESILKR